jgi:hypothetical protein
MDRTSLLFDELLPVWIDFIDSSEKEHIISLMGPIQMKSPSSEVAYVPTSVGILLTPIGTNKVFSCRGAGPDVSYDMDPVPGPVLSAVTDGVRYCGVTAAKFEGYKLLTHGLCPRETRQLTARALQLANDEGASLDEKFIIGVHCNHEEGNPEHISGPKGYKANIEAMAKNLQLDVEVEQIPISITSLIYTPD